MHLMDFCIRPLTLSYSNRAAQINGYVYYNVDNFTTT